jgi:Nucleotidyl transferase AbiEii toxin, Type IV TA system
MRLSELNGDVARIALEVAAKYGFVLGGGNALVAHGLISRPTQDVDLVTDRDAGVKAAAGEVERALRAAGYTVARDEADTGLADMFYGFDLDLAEWNITGPDGRETILQIARFDRERPPVVMAHVGPVLAFEDAVAAKVHALVTRWAERDYWDVAQALGRWSPAELIELACQHDPSLQWREFTDAGRQLDKLEDEVFELNGLGPKDIKLVRKRFRAWPRS